jgi:hypothetical protein
MTRIRNLTPGVLHVPAAKLRLQGGAVADVERVTPEIQKQIDAGRIAVVTDEEAAKAEAPAPKLPEPPADFDKLDETDAIEYVEDETDPKVIESILQTEQRGGVVSALKDRLKEIGDAHK